MAFFFFFLHSDCLNNSREVTGFIFNNTLANAFHCPEPSAMPSIARKKVLECCREEHSYAEQDTLHCWSFFTFSSVKNDLMNNLFGVPE